MQLPCSRLQSLATSLRMWVKFNQSGVLWLHVYGKVLRRAHRARAKPAGATCAENKSRGGVPGAGCSVRLQAACGCRHLELQLDVNSGNVWARLGKAVYNKWMQVIHFRIC